MPGDSEASRMSDIAHRRHPDYPNSFPVLTLCGREMFDENGRNWWTLSGYTNCPDCLAMIERRRSLRERIMAWWYDDALDFISREQLNEYIVAHRQNNKRIGFFHFRAGRPGGGWFVRRGHIIGEHSQRVFGMYFVGAFGRLGWSVGVWPIWNIYFHGYLFPPKVDSRG